MCGIARRYRQPWRRHRLLRQGDTGTPRCGRRAGMNAHTASQPETTNARRQPPAGTDPETRRAAADGDLRHDPGIGGCGVTAPPPYWRGMDRRPEHRPVITTGATRPRSAMLRQLPPRRSTGRRLPADDHPAGEGNPMPQSPSARKQRRHRDPHEDHAPAARRLITATRQRPRLDKQVPPLDAGHRSSPRPARVRQVQPAGIRV